MPATMNGKLCTNVWQVDRTEWVHILWPLTFFPKAGANLFSLTCKLLKGNKISSDHQKKYWSVLHVAISSLIAKSRLAMVWFLELNFFQKCMMSRHKQLQPHARKISMTYTLSSDILLNPSTMPPLKPSVSKSPVPSNCVKIVLWVRQSNSCKQEGCSLFKNFCRKVFLWHNLSLYSHFWHKVALATCHRQQ